MIMIDCEMSIYVMSEKYISLRAESCRREARREKFTHENCTLPTIHLGPAGWRPALGLVNICINGRTKNAFNQKSQGGPVDETTTDSTIGTTIIEVTSKCQQQFDCIASYMDHMQMHMHMHHIWMMIVEMCTKRWVCRWNYDWQCYRNYNSWSHK